MAGSAGPKGFAATTNAECESCVRLWSRGSTSLLLSKHPFEQHRPALPGVVSMQMSGAVLITVVLPPPQCLLFTITEWVVLPRKISRFCVKFRSTILLLQWLACSFGYITVSRPIPQHTATNTHLRDFHMPSGSSRRSRHIWCSLHQDLSLRQRQQSLKRRLGNTSAFASPLSMRMWLRIQAID